MDSVGDGNLNCWQRDRQSDVSNSRTISEIDKLDSAMCRENQLQQPV
jgi:hypothetical protein